MDILILGGTGAIGIHVIEFLKNKGHEIIVTSRKERSSGNGVTYIQGNARDNKFIDQVCGRHWDCIIDFMVYSTELLQSRIDMMLNATDQYVFISSARVYADSSEKLTEESTRLLEVCTDKEYLATDEYALAKAREENILFFASKRNWTIVRPSLTYSETRLQLGVYEKESWLYRALHGRSIVFSRDLIDNYYTLSYGKDVAEGIAALVGKKEAIGQVFHIVQEESFQWKNILAIYAEELEKASGKKPSIKLSEKCTNLQLMGVEKYQVIYGRYFNRFFDNSKIRKFVNTDAWLKPDEGLRFCIQEFLKNPKFNAIDWTKEALIDRAAHEWTPLNEISGTKTKLRYLKHRLLG